MGFGFFGGKGSNKLQNYVKKLPNVAKLIQNAAKCLKKLLLSGYFIQLLRYTAPPDARCTTVRLRSVETASLPMA